MSDIVLGIKLKYDGKDVTGGVAISREQFKQIAVDARKAGEATAGSFTSAAQGVRSMSAQLDQAKNTVIGYLGVTQGVQAARWILDQASAMQQLDARLKVATSSQYEYVQAQAGVFEIANRWGVAVDETARTFARLNPVITQLGGNSATTLKMVDGLAASLRLSGASTAESTAVLLQFSQAMGSGRVGGDEFRSMMENAEPLMRAVGKELGKTTGELRQMAEDGKLTSSVFGNALLPAIDKLKQQAEQIPLGISQAWQVLENNLKRDFGREFEGQATTVGSAIKGLADHSSEAAIAVHMLADGLVIAGKAGLVLAAGAGAVWIAKHGQAAVVAELQLRAMTAAQIAAAEAAVAKAAVGAAAAQAALPPLLAEKALLEEMAIFGPQRARVERDIAAAKAAGTLATNELVGAEIRLAEARGAATLAGRAGTAAAGTAGAAMTALGGPLGLVTAALTVGATTWALWGGSAKDAADDAEAGVDRALKALENQRAVAATGNVHAPEITVYRAKLAQLREARSEYWQENNTELKQVQRELAKQDAEIARREAKLKQLETESAKPAVASPTGPQLSAAGEWGKLTESLKWREKIVKKYNDDLLALQTAYADKWREATEKDRPALLRNQQAALAALAAEHKAALDALPGAKEAKAIADAEAEARIRSAEAASKRVLEVLKHEHEQYRLSTGDYLNTLAAVKANAIGQEIDALQAKIAAATKESDRIPLHQKIKELKAQLAQLPADTAAAFENAEAKARETLDRLGAVSGKALDPLAQAGLQFTKDFGEIMQKAAIDGREDIVEAGRAVWTAMADRAQFDAARQEFEALFEALRLELDAVRQAAERDGGALAGLRADQEAEAIKSRLLPALEAAQRKMGEFAGSSLENRKFATGAAREVQKTINEISPHWKKFADDIERSLTDALMRGFESGKDLAENFVDSLRNTLKTATLKVAVQAVVDPIMGGVRSAMGGGGSLNLPFGGGGLYDAFAMSGAGQSLGLSTAYIDALGGTAGLAEGATSMTALGSGIGTALPWVGGALALASMGGLFGGEGDAMRTGRFVSPFAFSDAAGDPTQANNVDGSRYNWLNNSWFSADMQPALDQFDAQMQATELQIAAKLGLQAKDWAAINARLGALGDKRYSFGTEHTDVASSGVFAQIEADRLQAIAEALGMSLQDLRDQMSGAKKSAYELARETQALSAEQAKSKAQALLGDMSGTLSALDAVTGLRSTLMSDIAGIRGGNTYASRMGGLRELLAGETNTSRQVALAGEMKDLVMERYRTEREAIEETRSAALATQAALRESLRAVGRFASELLVGDLSPLSAADQLEASRGQFADVLARARTGDTEALAGLSGAASTYLGSARGYYASSDTYTGIFGGVQSTLAALGLSAEAVMDTTDWQARLLAVDTDAVTALGSLTAITEDWTLNLENLLVDQTRQFEALGIKLADIGDNTRALDARIATLIDTALASRFDRLATAVNASAQTTARAVTNAVQVALRA